MKAPCQHCPDRHEKCHSTCVRYKEFQAYREAIRTGREKYNNRPMMKKP